MPRPALIILAALCATSAAPASAATSVEVSLVQAQSLPRRAELSGQLSAARHAELSPRLSGVVERIVVDAGARVEAGDRLLKLDDRLARLSLSSAEAAARAATVRLADAQRMEEEGAPLAAKGLLPASQLDSLRAAREVAQAEAHERGAEAALLREQLNRHWLTAPFDGVVVERQVDMGEWVQASDAVLTLVSDAELRFDARAPQEWYGRIDPGAPIRLHIDGREAAVENATVAAEVPASDTASRSFLLRLAVPAQTPALLPGASGRVELGLRGDRRAIAVPREALVSYPDGGRAVWVAVDEGSGPVARSLRVQLDPAISDPAMVLDGLEGGERVIIRGQTRLRDGEPLTIAAER
ncbi:efflux RND transporter periplasmic adaptor subunit [Pseudomarimonas salicorniae]|uniref:Efflux RND transporter periplasmic adaptor subunit n=1 Tax=Pseudomarimonas salicorniae TaxID=2933270 RepID=A0ABT0GH38_9GAMM|nr:efflux RND transporter periplasmic adaptor subunit [Lysobacter sp. CAU 1642]MCK7593382.1 efflux RND transporter periplasmic adaptor subunit [Lysobacter sp. CAU 1642]